jgi:hypothetical protein
MVYPLISSQTDSWNWLQVSAENGDSDRRSALRDDVDENTYPEYYRKSTYVKGEISLGYRAPFRSYAIF